MANYRGLTAPEMTTAELARMIESEDGVHVLDVRAPSALETSRIDIVPEDRFHNLPGSQVMMLPDLEPIGVPRGADVAVVCNSGNSSRPVAKHLEALGYRARSVLGGMIEWQQLLVPREVPPPRGVDRLVQLDRIGRGGLSYVLIDDGEAFIVDPTRRIETFLEIVKAHGAHVVSVADTHAHADYVSGAARLSSMLNVPYYLHANDAVYPYDGTPARLEFSPIGEGDEIPVGRCALRVVHTPGHTEGSVSFLIGDGVALTGDFLFVASVGRPDLGDRTAEWTPVLWRSLERARTEWSAETRILPAHYSQPSERNGDGTVSGLLGRLAAVNEPFAIAGEAAFTRWILERAGSFPAEYRRIKAINLGLHRPDEMEMTFLEVGRNQCALG
jgi:glyoxylase-like metal-dependent hydrolase (beta-lactamase superfamily II)/rhodanese-related sulfurtransferase